MSKRKVNDRNVIQFSGLGSSSSPESLIEQIDEIRADSESHATSAVFNSSILNTATGPGGSGYGGGSGWSGTGLDGYQFSDGSGYYPPEWMNQIEWDTTGITLPSDELTILPDAVYEEGTGYFDPDYSYYKDLTGAVEEEVTEEEAPAYFQATVQTGFPALATIIGTGLISQASALGDTFAICEVDTQGDLGFGSNCFIGIRNVQISGTNSIAVLVYDASTGTVTNLGFPVAGVTTYRQWQLLRVAGDLFLKEISGTGGATVNTIYYWNQAFGWSTASGTGMAGKMSICEPTGPGGFKAVVGAGGGNFRYIDRSGGYPYTVTVGGAITAGHYVLAKGPVMWRSDGYVSAASLTPTWTLKSAGMSEAQAFSAHYRADVDGVTGDLAILSRMGTPLCYGVTVYSYVNGAGTSFTNLFTTTGSIEDGEFIGDSTSGIINNYNLTGTMILYGFHDEDVYGATTGTDAYSVIYAFDPATVTITPVDAWPYHLTLAANAGDAWVGVAQDYETGAIAYTLGQEGLVTGVSVDGIVSVTYPA